MAKQRASLSGRGKEVIGETHDDLFADPSAPAPAGSPASPPEPAASEPALVSDPTPESDIESALAREADASEFQAIATPPAVPAMRPREETPSDPARSAGAHLPAIDIPGGTPSPLLDLDAVDVPGSNVPAGPGRSDAVPPAGALRNQPDEAELRREMLANTSDYPPAEATPVSEPKPPATPVNPSPAPSPAVPPADPLADQILAAVPENAPPVPPADNLTDQILAAVPADAPPVSGSPVGGTADEQVFEPVSLRSPLPPFSGPPSEPPAVGLAPVAGEVPPPSPPGGPAPARIRLGGILLEAPLQGDVTPPGPGGSADSQAAVSLQDMSADEASQVLARITPEQQKALARDIDRLYDKVTQELANDALRGERALEMLHQSRMILIERPQNFVDAEYQVQRVHAMVMATLNSRQWAADYGRRLFTYETVWMAGLLLAYMPIAFWPITGAWLARTFGLDPAGVAAINQASSFISTLIWGGLGGTIGALWSLWYHISERRDFDREYNMWYLTQPIMGIVLGGIVYLLFTTGLLVLQTDISTADTLGARLLPALVAAIGGFRQNFVYEQMGRIVQIFSGQQNNSAGDAPADENINVP